MRFLRLILFERYCRWLWLRSLDSFFSLEEIIVSLLLFLRNFLFGILFLLFELTIIALWKYRNLVCYNFLHLFFVLFFSCCFLNLFHIPNWSSFRLFLNILLYSTTYRWLRYWAILFLLKIVLFLSLNFFFFHHSLLFFVVGLFPYTINWVFLFVPSILSWCLNIFCSERLNSKMLSLERCMPNFFISSPPESDRLYNWLFSGLCHFCMTPGILLFIMEIQSLKFFFFDLTIFCFFQLTLKVHDFNVHVFNLAFMDLVLFDDLLDKLLPLSELLQLVFILYDLLLQLFVLDS